MYSEEIKIDAIKRAVKKAELISKNIKEIINQEKNIKMDIRNTPIPIDFWDKIKDI